MTQFTNKLAEICDRKRGDLIQRKARASLVDLERRIADQDAPRGFTDALLTHARKGYAIIAEIKKASPSKGLIRQDFNPVTIAQDYARAGAACLSVLTDRDFFQGDDCYLAQARDATSLPVLRKDFMVDPWQIAESRALGADAVLLIMAALDDGPATEMAAAAKHYGMAVLVEVHDEAEFDRGLSLGSGLIGINNRNLSTFETDLSVSERLAARAPDGCVLVSESGLATRADLDRLASHDIRTFLIGESLMRQDDVAAALAKLLEAA